MLKVDMYVIHKYIYYYYYFFYNEFYNITHRYQNI